jgi:adenylate cyclase
MTRLRDLVSRERKSGIALPAWLHRLVSTGIVATDEQVVERQRCVNVAAFAVAATALSHLIINSLHDFRGLIPINIDNVFVVVACLLVPRLHRFGGHAGAIVLVLVVLFTQMFVVWSFGLASQLHVYYTLGGAILFFFGVENWRLFLVFFGLFVIALIVVLNFAPLPGLVMPEDSEFRELLRSQAMINATAIIAALLFYALWDRHRTRIELQDEHELSEALIATVMPPAIAARLKSGQEARIADHVDMLSVMFADLVGFTEAAHDLAPEEVVDFLDGLVRGLDALCEQYEVDKIKTIGDSYMAAGGFDGRAVAGAIAVGRLALAMMEVIERQPPLGRRKLKLRAGIHCGPATAGVIGDTRFSYDVWGDAVNTASRMESHGEPGCIQVSAAFRDLTQGAFVFEERGATEIKGIGETRTFFLLGTGGSGAACRTQAQQQRSGDAGPR